MFAVYAAGINREYPLSVLGVGELSEPDTPSEWVTVKVKAASINHHDLWALKGQALKPDQVPMILGTDASGVTDDGREVLVHAVIADAESHGGDETLDPRRTILSERYPGTLADWVRVPAANLIDKPSALSFEQAACLPTAYLTAYRMLASKSGTKPGDTVLIQGAGGGVSTALIILAKSLNRTVWVTSRDEAKREWARSIGADAVFSLDEKLPGKVDAVMETVGEATWAHSMRALRPGGTIVISGATSGANPPADLNRLFFLQLRVVGSTMGTLGEFRELVDLLVKTGARPVIDQCLPMEGAAETFARMNSGDVRGKLVLTR